MSGGCKRSRSGVNKEKKDRSESGRLVFMGSCVGGGEVIGGSFA